MKRITKREIESAIELFVNNVYDGNEEWLKATYDEWLYATYTELIAWKSDDSGNMYESNENRFDGKEETLKRIRPILNKRLKELVEELYEVKAYTEINRK